MDVENSRIMQIKDYVTLYNMTVLYSIQTLQFLFCMKSKKYQVVLSTPSNWDLRVIIKNDPSVFSTPEFQVVHTSVG